MNSFCKQLLRFRTVLFLPLMSLLVISCSNDDDTPSRRSGQLVNYTLVKTDSFNDIIEAQRKAGNQDAVKKLEEKKKQYFASFKKDIKAKALKKGITLKSKNVAVSNRTLKTESDVDAFFNEFGVDPYCPYVATYNLKYTTTSANGEEITASARALINYGVYSPLPFWEITAYAVSDSMLLHSHTTQMENSKTPTSQSGFGPSECGLLYFEAWNDIMVVSPDYEGYGASKDRVHPYLIQGATGKQCFDAACAAKHWKETGEDSDGYDFNGFEDNFFTVAAGFSQGGSVSLAIQNYIQNNDSDNRLRLKGALCGDGPYNPFATYSRYADEDYQLWLPSVITLILRAYLYYYSDSYLKGFTVEDYLKPEIIKALKDNDPTKQENVWGMIDSKDKSTSDVDSVIFNALGKKGYAYIPVSDIITQTAMDTSSASYKALKAALDANNMADPSKWNGSKNNKITAAMHWKVDEAVPYKNYESLTGNLTVKDKGWDPSQDSVLRDIIAVLSNLGITDSLDDVLQLFRNEPSGKASNGSHIAAGKLFFVGNLFYREDHLHMDD